MKRYGIWKLVLLVIALGCIFFGWNELESDPSLRQLKGVSIAALERGDSLPEGQYIEITDAYLLPMWLVETSHSRKRGDSAYVSIPVGSKAMQALAFDDKPVRPGLILKLSENYKTGPQAQASMKVPSRYEQPYPVRGLLKTMSDSQRTDMAGIKDLQLDAARWLHEGSAPWSYGTALGLVVAGVLLILGAAAWVLVDVWGERWREGLAQPEVGVFAGDTPWLIGVVLGMAALSVFGGVAVAIFKDSGTLNLTVLAMAVMGVALLALSLWLTPLAVLLSDQAVSFVRPRSQKHWPLSGVRSWSVDETKVRGVALSTYTLHGQGKPIKLGSSLFKGGIDNMAGFGAALRKLLNARLAPAMLARMARGEWVSFGPLVLSQQGLSKKADGRDAVPWSQLGDVTLKNGKLKIKQKGKMLTWATVAVKKLHNIDVLMHVLERRGAAI